MLDYIIRRVLIAIPTLLLISFICFIVINLPAGDVITTYEQNLVGNRGWGEEEARIEGDNIRREYGLDRPIPVQYFYWLFAFIQDDFGVSLVTYDCVASEVIWTNLGYTMLIASLSLGLSMPGFLLALSILVYMTFVLDLPLLTGLYSPEYADAPWSFGRVKDLAAHIWLPVFVGGIPGIASLMRIMRGNLLDELGRQYVETARAKGMAEKIVVIKHAVRVAINPLISLLGMQFPEIVSGGVITAIVLGLRTIGPTLNSALQAQDVYVASAILMLLSVLLVLGNLVADLLLAWVDPRVRFDQKEAAGSRWISGLPAIRQESSMSVVSEQAQTPLQPGAPRAPAADLDVSSSEEVASRGRILGARIMANRLGIIGIVWLVLMVSVALFADFYAPYSVDYVHEEALRAPPQRVHIFRDGKLVRPFVYGFKSERDARTFLTTYTEDPELVYPIHFFVEAEPYKLWGLITSSTRLFGVEEGGMVALFGTGRLGRDVFSRVLTATRISLSVPIIGMLISVIPGSSIGVASGYWGGVADILIQRLTEVLMSFPRIPLWMALAATLPPELSSINRYLGVTIVLALIGWAGLCRQIRGKTLALKESDFIMAGRAAGSSTPTILFRHLIPNCFSHIVVVATLSIPGLILAESSLSFLGIGITPPLVSWGTLLKDAQSVQVLTKHPWLLAPGVFMVLTVLAVNFLGDALRDALDPYSEIR